MIRSPLGLRLDASGPIRDQIREAARLGAKGVVIDAVGDLAPARLSETGRRELRHLLRSVGLELIALGLPTRRAFDSIDQLDDRLGRAEAAFGLAYELGARIVLARLGSVPPETDPGRREVWLTASKELGRRASHRGVRLAIESGTESGEILLAILEGLDSIGLAVSIDPAALLARGHDPIATTRVLAPWVAHAYATETRPSGGSVVSAGQSGLAGSFGGLDWEEFLGALEEIGYRGYLTVAPDPARGAAAEFAAVLKRLEAF